jgi:hypothetical protein
MHIPGGDEMLKQEKLLRIYDYIKDNLYFCHKDMEIGKYEFNSNLLFGLLTSVNKGKQLSMGEYGIGKTTSSEYLLSFVYGIPRGVLVSSTVRGNPEITLDRFIGRPNLGELNEGREKVIWSLFVTLEPKIVDEFNRIPESKQNMFLDGMDRGNWQYLNDIVKNGDFSMFATINYKDGGNNSIVEAAVDRFEIAVESKHPGVNNMRLMRQLRRDKSSSADIVEDEAIEKAMYDVMLKDIPYADKKKEISPIRKSFRDVLHKKTGLEMFTDEELSDTLGEIRDIPLSKDADLMMDFVISEMYSCMMKGQKRSIEACNVKCHYQNLACGKKVNSDSVRSQFAEMRYAKSLAWLLGDSEVSKQVLATVLPYNIWHKMRFHAAYTKDMAEATRTDPLQLYATKQLMSEITQRFGKYKPQQQRMFALMEKQNFAEAEKLAKEADHPVFYDYLRIS